MKKEKEAGKNPEWEFAPDPYLEINTRLAQALGYVVEAQDGIVKCWPKTAEGAAQDNWILLPNFVADESTNAEMLDERGYQFCVVEQAGGLWECAFQNGEHVGVTPPHISEALALADALLMVVTNKSRMT